MTTPKQSSNLLRVLRFVNQVVMRGTRGCVGGESAGWRCRSMLVDHESRILKDATRVQNGQAVGVDAPQEVRTDALQRGQVGMQVLFVYRKIAYNLIRQDPEFDVALPQHDHAMQVGDAFNRQIEETFKVDNGEDVPTHIDDPQQEGRRARKRRQMLQRLHLDD